MYHRNGIALLFAMTTNANPAAGVREWGCRTDDILVAHAVFRRLFSLLPPAVRTVHDGDRARARTIARRLRMAVSGLHHHHRAEDSTLWDTLESRAPGCALHVHLMRAQHARISVLMDATEQLAQWWVVDGDPVVRDRLAERLDELEAALALHLKDEEGKVLPVVQRVMSQLEWEEVGEAARSGIDPRTAFVMLGLMINAATSEQRAEFEEHVPAIATVLYRLFGHLQYERAMADLGDVPAPPPSPKAEREWGIRFDAPVAT